MPKFCGAWGRQVGATGMSCLPGGDAQPGSAALSHARGRTRPHLSVQRGVQGGGLPAAMTCAPLSGQGHLSRPWGGGDS